METFLQLFSQAKAKLLLEKPFFGELASRVEVSINDDLRNFRCSSLKLELSSEYASALSGEHLQTLLATTAMHSALSFEARAKRRSGNLWHLASEYAINSLLKRSGFSLNDEMLYKSEYDNLYAEQIYAMLCDDLLRDDLESESHLNEIEGDIESEIFSEASKQLLGSQEGELGEALRRAFKLKKAHINWQDELRGALQDHYRDDFSFAKPSKKLLHADLYLPSASSSRFKFVVAVDSSGSIDEELLSEFISELNHIVATIPNYEIDLVVCDDRIRSHQKFYTGEKLDLYIEGGGGTSFVPLFEFVDKHLDGVDLLIYFSDLDGKFPLVAPSYGVKWVSASDTLPPFGEVIALRH